MLEEINKKSVWSEREMGAFWTQDGQKGKYLTGYVEVDELGVKRKLRVVMFPNRHKTNDKAPDYKLYISKDRDSETEEVKEAPAQDNTELPESLV